MPTEALAIAPIGLQSVAEGCALTAEVDWNQTAEDWAFFFAHGTVFGARDDGGRLVATAGVLPYSAGFAWVSLVIVSRSHRGHGLGTRLLNECIALLRARGRVGVLDATPAGEKVYEPLGFKPLFGLSRWNGPGLDCASRNARARPLQGRAHFGHHSARRCGFRIGARDVCLPTSWRALIAAVSSSRMQADTPSCGVAASLPIWGRSSPETRVVPSR